MRKLLRLCECRWLPGDVLRLFSGQGMNVSNYFVFVAKNSRFAQLPFSFFPLFTNFLSLLAIAPN